MTDDRDDLSDEQMVEMEEMEELDESEAEGFGPFYVMDHMEYECPLGFRLHIRCAIDTAEGEIIAAEVRRADGGEWRRLFGSGLQHLASDILYEELDEISSVIHGELDLESEYACISPFDFENSLPEWAIAAQSSRR